MRTSGAEPTEVGMVGSLRSLRSTIPRDRRCVSCSHASPAHVFAYRLLDWSYRDAYIAYAPRGAPRARLLEQASGRRACGVLCKELRDALASPR